VVHPALDPELKGRLQKIFLNMHENTAGKQILDKLMIDKFVVVNDSLYNSVRQMDKALK